MQCFGKLTHFLMFGYDPKNEPNLYIIWFRSNKKLWIILFIPNN